MAPACLSSETPCDATERLCFTRGGGHDSDTTHGRVWITFQIARLIVDDGLTL